MKTHLLFVSLIVLVCFTSRPIFTLSLENQEQTYMKIGPEYQPGFIAVIYIENLTINFNYYFKIANNTDYFVWKNITATKTHQIIPFFFTEDELVYNSTTVTEIQILMYNETHLIEEANIPIRNSEPRELAILFWGRIIIVAIFIYGCIYAVRFLLKRYYFI